MVTCASFLDSRIGPAAIFAGLFVLQLFHFTANPPGRAPHLHYVSSTCSASLLPTTSAKMLRRHVRSVGNQNLNDGADTMRYVCFSVSSLSDFECGDGTLEILEDANFLALGQCTRNAPGWKLPALKLQPSLCALRTLLLNNTSRSSH